MLLILDPSAAEPWYLLGRVGMVEAAYLRAYETLQQAIYRASRVPEIWTTVGILYFSLMVPQIPDSLDAFSRSMRLNPSLWINWYNLGVLVSKNRNINICGPLC